MFGIGIYTDSLSVNAGMFTLGENQKGNAYALYFRLNNQENTILYTKNNLPGQLIISNFDEPNQIAYGTFWFNVFKHARDTIKITDGRFDMQFTK